MSPHNILMKINDKLLVLSHKKYLMPGEQFPPLNSFQDQENEPRTKPG